MKADIQVTVEPGVFAEERAASWWVGGVRYAVNVEVAEIREGNLLRVRVVRYDETMALVWLPPDSLEDCGRLIYMPTEQLMNIEAEEGDQVT